MLYLKDFLKKLIAVLLVVIVFAGLAILNNSISNPYSRKVDFDYSVKRLQTTYTEPELVGVNTDTVVTRDASVNAEQYPECLFALMVGDDDNQVYVAKNAHRRMYPASMTKLMTASVVCDKLESGIISLDDQVTLERNYDLTSEGVRPCELHKGYTISVNDLMYGLLLESNNYYALILADYIAGDEESFCKLMNEKAASIGATNSHFANPHGLDNKDHYTTAYDIYLIIKEAESHTLIRTIDALESYEYTYRTAEGAPVDAETAATNYFKNGNAELPAGVTMDVWKTGTTDGAGNCLAIYFIKDGKRYVAVASCLTSKPELYSAMVRMLCSIDNQ